MQIKKIIFVFSWKTGKKTPTRCAREISTIQTKNTGDVRNKNTGFASPTKININRGFVLERQLLSTLMSIIVNSRIYW